ncbi:uncharacterized protein LOC121368518 [Gigantopelta aegis]|uniref:uncharacterized protein LOC121368518 n=1 Tax=Gigantopelta aegis TaxID=1735272 RepID=UPI001B889B1B|nr:uncharacterized protein LOC121368518 [Gigantopelta aegis]
MLHDDSRVGKLKGLLKTENENSDSKISVQGVCGHTRAGKGECTMAIIPVRVKLKNGLRDVKIYAFFDPGSSISFCCESLVRELGGMGHRMSITMDTMGNPFSMETYAVDGLQVCDLELENEIDLPRVYTKDKIPVSKRLAPTNKDISCWKHLDDINLPDITAEVGLLIGNNVPDAYTPFEVKSRPEGSPHAVKTRLGWIVWNMIREGDKQVEQVDSVFTVNRAEIVAVQEMEQLKQLDKLVRDSINRDFPERLIDDKKEHSQEDKKFLDLVNGSITHSNGHYCIGLPFKENGVKLPDNKLQALQRLASLKRKLQKNSTFCEDYVEFMSKVVKCGYAEQVPKEELERLDGRVWYIPHHGVYHSHKPGKIRVVFDCAATYKGTSLNSVLLQGPDLTNSLLGVFFRFRQEEVAIMGDIEAMFYQVHLPKDDSDCLRFFWWPEGNLHKEPTVYRMQVHLFGATSSPSCSSFALRHTAEEFSDEFKAAANVIKRHFYVDDCLTSVKSEEEAVDLIKETVALCKKGGFRLTKWISNNLHVLDSIPVEERAKDVKELDLEHQRLPNERALGVVWFVESDTLGFKIQQHNKPPTRCGILSTVSSVYDPLGMAAPFVLNAKLLLQDLCRRNVPWDEEIKGNDLKIWQQWTNELGDLEKLNLQ